VLTDPGIGVRFQECVEIRVFFTVSIATMQATRDTGAVSPRVKWSEHDDLHLVPRFRICEAVSPLPHTSSWHSAELGTGTVSP